MGNYFGTDGVRGIYGKNLTCSLAFKIGNALTQIKPCPRVIVGKDTRTSGDALCLSTCAGIVQGGGSAIDVGVCPTAGISFLVQKNFDFGVMITASHNPPAFNGIKIFGSNGEKLSSTQEDFLEDFFKSELIAENAGFFQQKLSLKEKYCSHLKKCVHTKFSSLFVVLDCCNGATAKIAPAVFKSLGAKICTTATASDGEKINVDCGCLFPQNLQQKVKKLGADVGFAFDGDGDRVLAVDESGEIFDGDKLLYILAKSMKEKNTLCCNCVVGTSHTNSGIAHALNRNKINLIRTDIGDKYVIEAMEKMGLSLGGEQSGHIIIKPHAKTGDGILCALKICEIMQEKKKSLHQLFDAQLVEQCNLNICVQDKIKVLNSENLKKLCLEISNEIAPTGRVLVRASGTEEKVRIMVEHPTKSEFYARKIEDVVKEI